MNTEEKQPTMKDDATEFSEAWNADKMPAEEKAEVKTEQSETGFSEAFNEMAKK